MKLNYLKEKKELVSVVLLGVSAVLAILILVRITGFFTASVRAENLVKNAIDHNNTDPDDMERYFAKYKALADELKKNNLFTPPAPKQHPVKEVSGILGNEVIIGDKLYKVGDMVGDAKIVAIGPNQVTIEWDGKEKTFSPADAGNSSQPGGPKGSRETARGSGPAGGSAQMVAVGAERGPGGRGDFSGLKVVEMMKERFQNMSEPERDRFMAEMKNSKERYMKMSEAERIKFKSEMLEKLGGGEPGGRRGPDGGKQGGK
jgi:hypothetical protein